MTLPTFTDVLRARKTIASYLQPTPLHRWKSLDEDVGTEVWVKHENHQPIAAFKIRGGINFISHLDEASRARGVITASTGNHGQSIAYASQLFSVRCIVAMPNGANPVKARAIEDFGAEIHDVGENFDHCREYVEEQARTEGMTYVSSGDELHLIAGVGTYGLEIMEALPDVDVIIVPIGGGSGAAGVCIAAKTVRPDVQVIGAQSEDSAAAYQGWKENKPATAPNHSFAEGLATGATFNMPQAILQRDLDDFILVSDDEIREATLLSIEKTRQLVEPAGAAALAVACKIRERLQGKKVVLIQSGGNITREQLKALL